MNIRSLLWTCLFTLFLAGAARADVQYLLSGGAHTSIVNYTLPCSGGLCADFPAGAGLTGWFRVPTPLPGNSTVDLLPQVTAFSISDGINTYASTDASVRLSALTFTTNASGAIVAGSMAVERWLTGTSPHDSGDRVSGLGWGQASGDPEGNYSIEHNNQCVSVGASAVSGVPDVCLLVVASTAVSRAQGSGHWTQQPSMAVPTLGAGTLALLAALLTGAAWRVLRRRISGG